MPAHELPAIRVSFDTGIVVLEATEDRSVEGSFPEAGVGEVVCVVTASDSSELGVITPTQTHENLEAMLRQSQIPFCRAAVGDRSWITSCEAVAVLSADIERVKQIARDFAQEAILVWTPNSLSLLSTTGDEAESYGWRLADPAKADAITAAARMLEVRSEYVGAQALREAMQEQSTSAIGPIAAFSAYNELLLACPTMYGRIPPLDEDGRREIAAARAKPAEEEAKRRREQEARDAEHRAQRLAEQKRKWQAQEREELERERAAEEAAERGRARRDARRKAKSRPAAAKARLSLDGKAWISELNAATLLMVSRYLADGTSQEWVFEKNADSVRLSTRTWPGQRKEEQPATHSTHATLKAAILADPTLTNPPAEAFTIIETLKSCPLTDYEVGEMFSWSVSEQWTPAADASWATAVQELLDEQTDWAEFIDEKYPDVSRRLAPCLINGCDVVPVLEDIACLLFDRDAEDLKPGRLLAEYSWASESGITWAGSYTLSLAGGCTLTQSGGDSPSDDFPSVWPCINDADIVTAVADFVTELELPVAAAVELYTGEFRDDVSELLEEASEWSALFIGLDDPERQALRDLLTDQRLFAATMQALAEPKSALGRRFKRALKLDRGNIPSGVLAGEWVDEA